MIAVDYTARIDPQALKNAGVSDVFRYLCYLPVGNWKVIQRAEYQELLAAGIGVTLNWEFDARDWLTDNGYAHGNAAANQARNLGYPAGCTIFGSADFDMSRTDWLTRGAVYSNQFAAGIRAGGYEPGVYGPYNVLTWVRDSGDMRRFWQAGMSTSWSSGLNAGLWNGANVRQRRTGTIGGLSVDINDIITPNWGQARGVNSVFDGWGELGPPTGDPYYTEKGPGGNLLRGINTILADLEGEILEGGSPYAKDRTPRFLGTVLRDIVNRLNALQNGVDALNARANTVVLVQDDRDLLNRAVSALEGASPIDADDRAAIVKLTDVLTELASHVK